MLQGKVLITGGAGFLGRAILRRAHRESWPCEFIVLSRDEEKQVKLKQRWPGVNCVLGDVRDIDRLLETFKGQQTIIHAAALKYIPEAEKNVDETIAVNVEGSRNVARAAIRAGVETVVGISTDKAVLPVNAYGMSKALMERLYAQIDAKFGTRFRVVRYGNVVGSTGSVIPLFQQQLKEAGQLTITDDRMTRFWLSAEEAVELIANTIQPEPIRLPHPAYVGSVIVPKCASMRILDLALLIAKGAPIERIGIRPGEKLHERLIDYQESARAVDFGDLCYLYPPTEQGEGDGKEPWSYSSQYPNRWITPDEMQAMIEDAVLV